MPTSTRESILNLDLKNNQKSTGILFNYSGTQIFNANKFKLTSDGGTSNTLIYVKYKS